MCQQLEEFSQFLVEFTVDRKDKLAHTFLAVVALMGGGG